MNMPNPSPEWTQEERLELIAYLAGRLHNYSEGNAPLVRATLLFVVTELMIFVTTKPAKFLEDNRDQVLEPFEEIVHKYVRP